MVRILIVAVATVALAGACASDDSSPTPSQSESVQPSATSVISPDAGDGYDVFFNACAAAIEKTIGANYYLEGVLAPVRPNVDRSLATRSFGDPSLLDRADLAVCTVLSQSADDPPATLIISIDGGFYAQIES